MMESALASALIMARTEFLLEVLVIALNAPAQLGSVDQEFAAGIGGRGGQPVFGWLSFASGPFDQAPFLGLGGKPGLALGIGQKPSIAVGSVYSCRGSRKDMQPLRSGRK